MARFIVFCCLVLSRPSPRSDASPLAPPRRGSDRSGRAGVDLDFVVDLDWLQAQRSHSGAGGQEAGRGGGGSSSSAAAADGLGGRCSHAGEESAGIRQGS